MRKKRIFFVLSLIALFMVCFSIMNQHIDELARYKYADEHNSEVILKYLNSDDVNYLIDRQLEPEEFMPYLGIEQFDIRNTNYYNAAKQARSAELTQIVDFVNEFRSLLDLDTLGSYLLNYDYETLTAFYRGEDEYRKGAALVAQPDQLLCQIQETQSVYKYVPKNLVKIENIPLVNQNNDDGILLTSDASEALSQMCEAAHDLNGKTCGNMILIQGYVSYDEQEERYEQAMLRYGADEAYLHEAMPGTSENQLGNTLVLVPAQVDLEASKENITSQQQWLLENAYRYGFILQNKTNERMSQFVLRYIGESDALRAQTNNLSLKELQ